MNQDSIVLRADRGFHLGGVQSELSQNIGQLIQKYLLEKRPLLDIRIILLDWGRCSIFPGIRQLPSDLFLESIPYPQ